MLASEALAAIKSAVAGALTGVVHASAVVWADAGQPYFPAGTAGARLRLTRVRDEQAPRVRDVTVTQGDPPATVDAIEVDRASVYSVGIDLEGLAEPALVADAVDQCVCYFTLPTVQAAMVAAGIALLNIPDRAAAIVNRESDGRSLSVWRLETEWRAVTIRTVLGSTGAIETIEFVGTLDPGPMSVNQTVEKP